MRITKDDIIAYLNEINENRLTKLVFDYDSDKKIYSLRQEYDCHPYIKGKAKEILYYLKGYYKGYYKGLRRK